MPVGGEYHHHHQVAPSRRCSLRTLHREDFAWYRAVYAALRVLALISPVLLVPVAA